MGERGPRHPGRGSPRRLGGALERLLAEQAPRTLLASAQAGWEEAVGEAIAAAAEPVSERDGVITIACASGGWAQELELMGEAIAERLRPLLSDGELRGLRFTADLARHR